METQAEHSRQLRELSNIIHEMRIEQAVQKTKLIAITSGLSTAIGFISAYLQ